MMPQTVNTGLRSSAVLSAVLVLSACGGGGGDGGGLTPPVVVDPGTYTPISDTTSTESTSLAYLGTTNTGALRFGSAGTLDHIANTVASGRLAGTINGQRTTVMLSGGGTATLTNPTGTDYLRVFTTQGDGDPIFGVVGQQTGPSGIPDNGSSRYSGEVELTVADGINVNSLTGDADIVASWAGGGSVTATFNAFQENGSNVGGDITITGATIGNSGFQGGTLSTSGAIFDVTGAADISGTRGYFFGPGSDEVGGTLLIDDTASGSREIVGVFSAN